MPVVSGRRAFVAWPADVKAMLDDLASGNGVAWTLDELLAVRIGLERDGELDAGADIERAEQLRAEWGTEPGQLWAIPSRSTIGNHRLLCGDATNADDIRRLMTYDKGVRRAVLFATDPPYGVDFEGQKYNPRAKDWSGIVGDKRQGSDLTKWTEAYLRSWFPYMMKDAAFYLWSAPLQEGFAVMTGMQRTGLNVQAQIVWNKNCMVLGQADFQWKHEIAWYAFWKGQQHRWFGGRDKVTVWDVKKIANSAYNHPMQKPVELFERPIMYHTRPGELVAEPFAGSGSQFVAAERLGRLCYGMEIDPNYAAVILERLKGIGLSPVRG